MKYILPILWVALFSRYSNAIDAIAFTGTPLEGVKSMACDASLLSGIENADEYTARLISNITGKLKESGIAVIEVDKLGQSKPDGILRISIEMDTAESAKGRGSSPHLLVGLRFDQQLITLNGKRNWVHAYSDHGLYHGTSESINREKADQLSKVLLESFIEAWKRQNRGS